MKYTVVAMLRIASKCAGRSRPAALLFAKKRSPPILPVGNTLPARDAFRQVASQPLAAAGIAIAGAGLPSFRKINPNQRLIAN
jgi:hypothetical protein